MRPNLFHFAKSELSQDAFLCWLLSWADAEQGKDRPHLHLVGKALLTLVYRLAKVTVPADFSTVKVRKQVGGIDILCIINGNTAILIEDKVHTKQHSDQLARYKDYVFKKFGFTADNVIPVYIQTGVQIDYSEVVKQRYLVLGRRDLLDILESDNEKAARLNSDILADFSNHLRQIEDGVQSFLTLPPSAWSSNSWRGFYIRLKNTLKDGNEYCRNPAGGFFAFWWHGDNEPGLYLELEQKKFCFKIEVDDAGKRREFCQHWHDQVILKCSKHGIKAKRPGRLRYGQHMTIAILDQEFPVVGSNGLIDMDETLKIIQSAQSVLDDCLSMV